jgi:hypothetical protein
MDVTIKTSDLALLIRNVFKYNVLLAEKFDKGLSKYQYYVSTVAPNHIGIQVPEVIKIDNYTKRIFNIIDSIMNEARYEVTEAIEIHIYGYDLEQIETLTIYSTPKN